MADKKSTYLQANEHVLVSNGTATATQLAPGERILLDDENAQHKFLRDRVEAGDPDYEHFQVVEVSLKDEAKAEEDRKEMLAKAEKIAAEAREEQARAAVEQQEERQELQEKAQEEGNLPQAQQTEFPAQDEEAQALAVQSGPGQRASTQEDVVEEQKATGRKRSSRSGGS